MKKQHKQIKYHDIYLTDIQMHAVKPRKPKPWWVVIQKHIRNKKPGRFYTTDINMKKDETFTVNFPTPPAVQKEIDKAKKEGKEVRLIMPKDGIPIYASKDMNEKLKAEKKKRI